MPNISALRRAVTEKLYIENIILKFGHISKIVEGVGLYFLILSIPSIALGLLVF